MAAPRSDNGVIISLANIAISIGLSIGSTPDIRAAVTGGVLFIPSEKNIWAAPCWNMPRPIIAKMLDVGVNAIFSCNKDGNPNNEVITNEMIIEDKGSESSLLLNIKYPAYVMPDISDNKFPNELPALKESIKNNIIPTNTAKHVLVSNLVGLFLYIKAIIKITNTGIVNSSTTTLPAVVNLLAYANNKLVHAIDIEAKITVLFIVNLCFIEIEKIIITIRAIIDLAEEIAILLQVAILKNKPPSANNTADKNTNRLEWLFIS